MLRRSLLAAAAAVMAGSQLATAIPKISVTGSKFFDDTGKQFYIKGIAYQRDEHDPLLDTEQCNRDAKLMAEVGANAIRVYHLDTEGDHQGCLDAFGNAGIYAFVDLDTFATQIEASTALHWNQTQYDRFAAVLDEFIKFDNVAGVFVGNEVLTRANESLAAPYVRAAARDLKAYRDAKGYRKIPIGYSAADIAELRPMLQNYLVCGGNASETIDFFSLNAYEWCSSGDDFKTSGYVNLQNSAAGYPVPIFFSETGCNTAPPRAFGDLAAIFGPQMVNTWSGAIVYEWIQEANGYGLITYGGDAKAGPAAPAVASAGGGPPTVVAGPIARSGTPTPITPDYSNLQKAWASVTPAGVKLADYTASTSGLTTPPCPSATPSGWELNGNPPLPRRDQTAYNPTQSAQPSAPSASATKGSAAGERELAGMSVGLGALLLGFVVWL